uniref:Elongation factor Ts, mitochondrial n=1 Tax=Pterothamnion crispum TaxID=1550583 RepID=A0A4D6X3A0_9FLOR|nr:Translation elongation factor Ts [Pterothamnion crispum]
MSEQISVKNTKELIKKVRVITGAGMTDCKKALKASNGDVNIAVDNLRKKGLASANKKNTRIATEGLIHSYIHAGSRIGVLIELNCETDFVARQVEFKELAKNIMMQLAACPDVQYISLDDIPQETINHEIDIEGSKEDLLNKPKDIKDKIVEGRINKRLKDLTLMNQPFIRNNDISIEELVKQHISLLGENIKVRRFERFILGQGLDKKSENFVDEVAKIIDLN